MCHVTSHSTEEGDLRPDVTCGFYSSEGSWWAAPFVPTGQNLAAPEPSEAHSTPPVLRDADRHGLLLGCPPLKAETPASLSCQLHYKRARPCEPDPTLQHENMGGTCMECLGGTTVCNSWEKQMSYNRPCGRVVTTVREIKHDGVLPVSKYLRSAGAPDK